MRFEHLVGDLFAAVRRQAVQNHRVRLCNGEQVRINTIIFEHFFANRLFAFLPHRRPHVGIEHVRALRRFFQIGSDGKFAVLGRPLHDVRIGAIGIGAGDRNLHARLDAADDEGIRHIVSVAHKAQF